ncbi:hypothetical protein DNK08_02755 [Stutzerimonas kirkiae]|nr:hypothetical protein DNK08_02755 [Stutzerimonas kirkiae]
MRAAASCKLQVARKRLPGFQGTFTLAACRLPLAACRLPLIARNPGRCSAHWRWACCSCIR